MWIRIERLSWIWIRIGNTDPVTCWPCAGPPLSSPHPVQLSEESSTFFKTQLEQDIFIPVIL